MDSLEASFTQVGLSGVIQILSHPCVLVQLPDCSETRQTCSDRDRLSASHWLAYGSHCRLSSPRFGELCLSSRTVLAVARNGFTQCEHHLYRPFCLVQSQQSVLHSFQVAAEAFGSRRVCSERRT